MTAQEFVNYLDRYIADKTPNFGDGDSVLTLLYEGLLPHIRGLGEFSVQWVYTK